MSQSPYYFGFTTLNSETSIEQLPIRGTVPAWLTGTLVRNGPARFEVGDQKYNHWVDRLAMLHKFTFAARRVSYANRYLRSRAYEEAMAKGRISRREFATDPCRSLFQRVASWFSPNVTDNSSVNIAHWGDAVLALTESRLAGFNTLRKRRLRTTNGRGPKLPIRSSLSFTKKWWRGFARSSMQLRQNSSIESTAPSLSVTSAKATAFISQKRSKSKSPALLVRKPGRFSNRS